MPVCMYASIALGQHELTNHADVHDGRLYVCVCVRVCMPQLYQIQYVGFGDGQ